MFPHGHYLLSPALDWLLPLVDPLIALPAVLGVGGCSSAEAGSQPALRTAWLHSSQSAWDAFLWGREVAQDVAFKNLVKVAQLLPDPRWLDGVGGQQD